VIDDHRLSYLIILVQLNLGKLPIDLFSISHYLFLCPLPLVLLNLSILLGLPSISQLSHKSTDCVFHVFDGSDTNHLQSSLFHSSFSVLRPDLWSLVLVILDTNVVYVVSEDFLKLWMFQGLLS
jgi:hypothetical protein